MRGKSFIWRVGEKPTGRFRSFQYRAWPGATNTRGDPLVQLHPVEQRLSYHPRIKETTELIVRVADHSTGDWQWRTLKTKPTGVTKAKEIAEQFFKENPDWLPKENKGD